MDYVIFSFGKIFIINEFNSKKFYKDENSFFIELTSTEKDIVNNLFNKSSGYLYKSERLNELLIKNEDIEHKDYVLNFLNWLEKIIPVDSIDNFYKNLETVKIKLNLPKDYSDIEDVEISNSYSMDGGYNTSKNEVVICPNSINVIWKIAKTTEEPIEFFNKHYGVLLMHELTHMASSNYDCKTKESLCGFDKYPSTVVSDMNRGLTEGMTEVIAMAGLPGTVEVASGYYIEGLITNQLIQIVGLDVVLQSYFGNKGTSQIENVLNNLIQDDNKSYLLFRRIEDNYIISDIDAEQTLLGNIQNSLVDYFIKKIEKTKTLDNFDISNIMNSVKIYKEMLITKEKLELIKKNPNNYVYLDESVEKFANYVKKLQEEYSYCDEKISVI